MLNLLRAEWKKITGNGMVISFTAWVFPVGLFGFVLVMTIFALVAEEMIYTFTPWTDSLVSSWRLLTGFPGNVFARLFFMAFPAVFLAGEYEWRTWKNIVPRQRRGALMLSKFVMFTFIGILSIFLTTLISGLGMLIPASLSGQAIEPALTLPNLLEVLPEYFLEFGLAVVLMWILAGMAILAALATRSIAGGILVGFGLALLESVGQFLLAFLGSILARPGIINAYAFFPTYSIDNVRSWLLAGAAFRNESAPGFTYPLTLGSSLLLLAAWGVGLFLLDWLIFHRQDLTS
jgi:ABC-type transport system involved in multi-copper enzyme maturation permease subunit